MKREIIMLVLVVFIAGVVVINIGGDTPSQESTNYTHIQEQGVTGDYDSPVINKTASEALEAIAA